MELVTPRDIFDARYLYLKEGDKTRAAYYYDLWDQMSLKVAEKLTTKNELERLLANCPFERESATFIKNKLGSMTE